MTRLPLTFRIFSWSALGLIVGSALAGFMACAPFPPSNPHVPTVKLAVFNSSAVDDPNLPFKLLYFSSTPWQETTGRQPYFANGIYPDVLVGNPFAFQIKVNFDLNAFSILDGSGADIIDRQSPPRVNTQRTDGSFPQPGEFGWRQRPVPPADRSVAAIELASFCGLAPL